MRFFLVTMLVLGSSLAVPVDKDSEKLQNALEVKKHEKRSVDCSNGHGIHIYCPPDYQAPIEPSPVLVQQPVVHVPVPVPQPVPHPVPVPIVVPVTKHVPLPIHVERKVEVPVLKPYPVTVEKIVHVDRPIPVTIEKHLHVPVDRPVPVPVPVPQPFPVPFEKVVHVHRPYPVAVPKPYAVPVSISKHNLYRDKEDVVDREEDDTVEYSLRQFWYFNQEKSVMSENVEIYAFHPLMIAITLIIQRDRPSTMGVISKAFDSIFKKPESIFIKTTVKDLFFNGILFDCTDITDFAGSAVCSALQEKEEILIREEGLRFRFGYLAKANGSRLPERIRVYRGIKNYKDVGRVVTIANSTKLKMWFGNPCNDIRGTDGTIFPPFLSKEKEVWVHSLDICRSIGAYHLESGKVQGFKTLHYTADLGDPSEDEDVRCLCQESEGCMPKNIFNADPCKSVPLRISLPHFYNSDPRYLEMIEGVNPIPEKHQMTFNFEPMTGTPIKAYKRIQFNVIVGPIPKLRLMKSFPEALFPLFWVEDGLELGNILIKPLKVAYLQILIAK
ncbi:PREDICTED: sensory neuron membrane protein 1-like [Trachymyrmex septentrionalis]|uniref:sensory neuron membrane protein 1-like n=1 Tax=Trachymyrmex septentrionalis TaxID=34720 RepID=UPI00084F8550|nr:PREDICTED: sensory neuron membrane protein 1-like [Trachymyrmex septentrionalis]